ncbi:hypothetical protein HA402_011955 [Bradysia odoriphaga]|nr:hypothetical protein HA402_011955 [Bradysia odoriphaga]
MVLLGVYNIDVRTESGVQKRDVDAIRVHPDWKPSSEKYDADLAILILTQTVEFTEYIRPVCMPENDPPVDVLGSIVGWGSSVRAAVYNTHESVPLQANLRILKDSYCYTTHPFLAFYSTPRLFCGGHGGSPGQGDSGGGLFVLSGSSWIQYGIISATSLDSNGNELSNLFSLYTNLKEFRSWIDKVVEESGSNVMIAAKKQTIEIDLMCHFEFEFDLKHKSYNNIRTDLLSSLCTVWNANVTDDNYEVRSFTGQHLIGHRNENVTEIWFQNGTLEYIPYGIGKKFTALEEFVVGDSSNSIGLKRLQRSNFENMENLYSLNVMSNHIETVDDDTLRDLPNLQIFNIKDNLLKWLGRDTFETNTKLQQFLADFNQLEYLHQDLFKNNALLETVSLMDNRELDAYECGRTEYIQPQILNGHVSDRGAWPFLAALFFGNNTEFFCASTIISAKHALTDVMVLLGAYNIDLRTEIGVQPRGVDDIHVHPDWDPSSAKYDADLAILILSEIVEFTKHIRPVCMPENDPPVDVYGSIVGWGLSERTTVYNRYESVPLQANLRILKDSYCYTTHPLLASYSTPRLFCGGHGGSPSKGDSGGGLFVLSGSSWIQYGIISATSSDSNGNTLSNVFSVYTNLKEFRSWIDKVVEESGSNVMIAAKKPTIETDLLCHFDFEIISPLFIHYICDVWNANVTDDNFEVRSFTGQHLTGFRNQNVTILFFRNDSLEYIPYGIGKKFKSLKWLIVGGPTVKNMGLKGLHRSNFENMDLNLLNVMNNDIEIVDEDSLRDLLNLTTFLIRANKLKNLGKDTFEKNTKLQFFNADYNQLEYLHQDLFRNTALLKSVSLRDNRLKLIYVDFTRLGSIALVDLRGNACMNRILDYYNNNKTEFQSHINQQCRPRRR